MIPVECLFSQQFPTDELSGGGIQDQCIDDEASPELKRQCLGKLNLGMYD